MNTPDQTATSENNATEPQVSRRNRRASMKHQNGQLLKNHGELVKMIKYLQENNHAMNTLLSDICGTVGIQIPKTPQEGVVTVERLKDRIIALVEFEKKHK